ncbi:hypothetical protein CPB84DRAFT_1784502 [Gymnopilus junonius]|uniref:Uncharacterized protein n=1 Tax=Gymnopilus junonius TaxID=109634 RepID=A0A9P5NH62_GYMJU|nr:hypothetical protein CPB84DRAFT_1784502 [Gymnopilus junonius]
MNQDGSDTGGSALPSRSGLRDWTRGVYPRAVIPFPESRQAAMNAALLVFKSLLPPNTKQVAIGLAVKTQNGETQWAQISGDESDWVEVVYPGDEVGVFMVENLVEVPYTPSTIPNKTKSYIPTNKGPSTSLPGKKLLYVMCTVGGKETTITITTNSYEECLDMITKHFNLKSDQYRSSVKITSEIEFDGKKVWSTIGDSASFTRLLEMRAEPIKLRASYSPRTSNAGSGGGINQQNPFNFTPTAGFDFRLPQQPGYQGGQPRNDQCEHQ